MLIWMLHDMWIMKEFNLMLGSLNFFGKSTRIVRILYLGQTAH